MIKLKDILNEGKSTEELYADEIGSATGTQSKAVLSFINKNNIDAYELFQYVTRGKQKEKSEFVSALAGNPGNKIQKMIIQKFGK